MNSHIFFTSSDYCFHPQTDIASAKYRKVVADFASPVRSNTERKFGVSSNVIDLVLLLLIFNLILMESSSQFNAHLISAFIDKNATAGILETFNVMGELTELTLY